MDPAGGPAAAVAAASAASVAMGMGAHVITEHQVASLGRSAHMLLVRVLLLLLLHDHLI
jgi:hypothetical protein